MEPAAAGERGRAGRAGERAGIPARRAGDVVPAACDAPSARQVVPTGAAVPASIAPRCPAARGLRERGMPPEGSGTRAWEPCCAEATAQQRVPGCWRCCWSRVEAWRSHSTFHDGNGAAGEGLFVINVVIGHGVMRTN